MFCVCFIHSVLLFVVAVTSIDTPSSVEERPVSLQITEFFIDTPQERDQDEYIEILGPPNKVFADAEAPGQFTYYLLMLENVGDEAGQVDKIIKLSGTSLNDEGYTWYYGSGGEKYPAEGGFPYEGTSENSGCTLILMAVPFGKPAPSISQDYDATSEGVAILGSDWDPDWVILESIGVYCNADDLGRGGALYAPVNFAAGDFANIATMSDADNTNTDIYDPEHRRGAFDEIEYVGRDWNGNWFAANLTDSGRGWGPDQRNYRIAGDDEHNGEAECVDQNDQVQYKALDDITTDLGRGGTHRPSCGCGEG